MVLLWQLAIEKSDFTKFLTNNSFSSSRDNKHTNKFFVVTSYSSRGFLVVFYWILADIFTQYVTFFYSPICITCYPPLRTINFGKYLRLFQIKPIKTVEFRFMQIGKRKQKPRKNGSIFSRRRFEIRNFKTQK